MQYSVSAHPLVSVIIPAYNAEKFIAATLQSVVSQTYKALEVIVVDDGSSDRTVEIVRAFAELDPRIMLLQQQNAEVAAARNLAIRTARGELIAPLDADDIWYPYNLEKQVEVMMQSDASVGLVYGWSVYLTEHGELTKVCQINTIEGDLFIPLIYGNLLGNASSTLIRRDCFERVGDYNTQLKANNAQGCEDWDLYLRIAECYQFRVVPELLIGYRQVIGSMSFDCQKMMRSCEAVLAEVRQKYPAVPDYAFRWAKSNFNWYLALRCGQCGDHWNAIAYLVRAAQLDYFQLLRPGFYSLLLLSAVKLVLWESLSFCLSIAGLKWSYKRRSPFRLTRLPVAALSQVQSLKHQRFPRKQFNDFLQRRWRSLRQEFEQTSGLRVPNVPQTLTLVSDRVVK
jgi:glycosyltransferase involved in cell wall biosynthesis